MGLIISAYISNITCQASQKRPGTGWNGSRSNIWSSAEAVGPQQHAEQVTALNPERHRGGPCPGLGRSSAAALAQQGRAWQASEFNYLQQALPELSLPTRSLAGPGVTKTTAKRAPARMKRASAGPTGPDPQPGPEHSSAREPRSL